MQLPLLGPDAITRLEQEMDLMEADLPPLRNFVLPGGSPANAVAHFARTVCRRSERRVVELAADPTQGVNSDHVRYLNRLSDWLFMASRWLSWKAGAPEVPWMPRAAAD
jgi:cob(I)alamin adenosyltransferase